MGDTGYTPPFSVSAKAINLIAEISAQIERYAIRLEQSDGIRLRKANRIKTIYSSLAIEGNNLGEEEVRDILEGKPVVAPPKDIQEVKNAIATYELYPTLNPFNVKDLLHAHGTMMQALINDAGRFRSGNVGVFDEKGHCVHPAPPPMRIPALMADLFDWLKHAKDHILIRSCVFHYEFEFIHPFSDGNGRMGRLWQSLILGKLNPIFEHLPVENMVYSNQMEYYKAINRSTTENDCSPFIDFMLEEILKTLRTHQGDPIPEDNLPSKVPSKVPNKVPNKIPNKVKDAHPNITESMWNTLSCIINNTTNTAEEIGSIVGLSDRTIRKHISALRKEGILVREGGNKGGRWRVIKK